MDRIVSPAAMKPNIEYLTSNVERREVYGLFQVALPERPDAVDPSNPVYPVR